MARYYQQIIEDQVQRWSKQRTEADRIGERPGDWPVITVSREFGAQGAALAAIVGQRLGFKVWDKELLQAIAEEGGGDEALLRSLDEHRRRNIDDAVRGILMGTRHTNMQYLRALLRVVKTIAFHGKSIIVGRGANYILAPEACLRVRVVCPLEQRVRGYALRQQISEQEARKIVEKMDIERAKFIQKSFKRPLDIAADYDLILNTGTYTLDQLANLVMLAYETKVGRRVPVAG